MYKNNKKTINNNLNLINNINGNNNYFNDKLINLYFKFNNIENNFFIYNDKFKNYYKYYIYNLFIIELNFNESNTFNIYKICKNLFKLEYYNSINNIGILYEYEIINNKIIKKNNNYIKFKNIYNNIIQNYYLLNYDYIKLYNTLFNYNINLNSTLIKIKLLNINHYIIISFSNKFTFEDCYLLVNNSLWKKNIFNKIKYLNYDIINIIFDNSNDYNFINLKNILNKYNINSYYYNLYKNLTKKNNVKIIDICYIIYNILYNLKLN